MAVESHWVVGFAQQLGRHGLEAFLAGLIIAVLASGLTSGLLRRRHARRGSPDMGHSPTWGRLFAGVALGFAGIAGAAGLFVAIAGRLGPGRTMGLADQVLADTLAQSTPLAAMRTFGLLTHLGDPLVLTILGALVAARLWRAAERLLALGWVTALAGNALLNPLLKHLFERARPLHDHGLAMATGFSFPSGHTSGAVVTYGMLLYVALRMLSPRWHPAASMVLVAVIVTTACSRVFLQVHFASDVAAGLLSGCAWLGVCIASVEFARHRARRRARSA